MTKLAVLVTGAGGVYGQATIENLRRSTLPVRIFGADVRWDAPGVLLSDEPIVLPRVDHPSYRHRLAEVIRERGVRAVFVSSGAEISALVEHRSQLEAETGAVFILPPADLYRLASDKLRTVEYLADNGLEHPLTILATESGKIASFVAQVGLPVIAKPRFGQGSRGIVRCTCAPELAQIAANREEYVLQQLLGDDDHEFTVGVIGTEDGDVIGSIVLRRWLAAGQTGACEVVEAPAIAEYAEAIARFARPRGYINVQLRLRDGRPVAFEINARVSSSTGFRGLAGFNEPELIVRRYLLGERPSRPNVRRVAMVRGLTERIIESNVWNQVVPGDPST
ncbi:MAG TPA: ATP-grasp domain-containing protein [Labilithrix sp.]|nr:ATP-grasp domain-containing protein [Labilithrix sp.]